MKDYAIENTIFGRSAIGDYFFLAKPGIVSLVLMSTLTGLCIGSRGLPDPWLTFWVMAGVGLATAGSAFLNNYADRDIDRLMERTLARALAVDAVSPRNTAITGIILVVAGVLFLGLFANNLTAILTAGAACGYVLLYTIILKRRTFFANQIGGIAGALPPAIGYVAVTQGLDINALILFAMVSIWQQPHALSIALKYKDEYAKACIPVIPVAKGVRSTKRRIAAYTALLLPVSVLPYVYGMAGLLYLIVSALFTIFYLTVAVRFLLSRRERDMFLFFYSIIYITVLFAAMVLDMV